MIEAALEIHWQRVRRCPPEGRGQRGDFGVPTHLVLLPVCPKVSVGDGGGWGGAGTLATSSQLATLINLQEEGPATPAARRRKCQSPSRAFRGWVLAPAHGHK